MSREPKEGEGFEKSSLSLADLKQEAAKYGATVEDDSANGWKCYAVVAPNGKKWAEGHTHYLIIEWEPAQKIAGWAQEQIAYAIERMGYGLVDCDDDDCDCTEED